jgi:hypothetical protein
LLAVVVMAASAVLAVDAPRPCSGRYLLSASVSAAAGAPAGSALVVASDGVSIPGVCTAVVPTVLKANKKGVTKLKAQWPVIACTGFTGKKVTLSGKIVEACAKFSGSLKGKKVKRKLQAAQSRCGDGTVDRDGGGETCDPPGTATCGPTCQMPPGALVRTLGVTNYDVRVPTDGSVVTGPIAVTLLAADGAPLGTINQTVNGDLLVSEFSSSDGEAAILVSHVQRRDFSPPRLIRLTLTVNERKLQIDAAGAEETVPGWLSSVSLTTAADALVVPPAAGNLGPGEDGAGLVATLPLVINGELVVSEAAIQEWFRAVGLEELGLQSFAAGALLSSLLDDPLTMNIASHFPPPDDSPGGQGHIHPEFHKFPFCQGLIELAGLGIGGIACGVCIPSLISTPVTGGISAMLAVPGCTLCAFGVGGSITEFVACKTSEYTRTTPEDCSTFPCNPANGEVPQVDERTEHRCWCTCNDDRCDTACAVYAQQLGTTFPDGSARPPLAPVGGDCVNNDCTCMFPPDDYCKATWPNYCGGGTRRTDRSLSYDCPRARCGDGVWTPSCPANGMLAEACDGALLGPDGRKGSCQVGEGCNDSCQCIPCACGPGTATPTCDRGEQGAFCDPASCQCRPGCLAASDCPDGKQCANGICVGEGTLRFTATWNADTDLDLHVRTPLGNEIYYGNRSADGGTLDADSCVSGCAKGTESVFFEIAPPGAYDVWVRNFNGKNAVRFTLEASHASGGFVKYIYIPKAEVDTQHYAFTVPE